MTMEIGDRINKALVFIDVSANKMFITDRCFSANFCLSNQLFCCFSFPL